MELKRYNDYMLEWALGLKDALKDLNMAKKHNFSLKAQTVVFNENETVDVFETMILPNRLLAVVKTLNIVIIRPKVWNFMGTQTIFIPEKCHETPDFSQMKGCVEAQKYEAFVAWTYRRNWINTKIATKGSIDWNLFGNKYSPKFAFDSNLIIDTKVLTQIMETPNIRLLLLMLSSALVGFLIGGAVSLGIYVILLLIR